MMPIFVAIFSFLASALGPLVARVLVGLGIGTVAYAGISAMLSTLKSTLISTFNGAGGDILSVLGMLKFDVAVNIMFAAVTARFVLAGLNRASGTISKFGKTS